MKLTSLFRSVDVISCKIVVETIRHGGTHIEWHKPWGQAAKIVKLLLYDGSELFACVLIDDKHYQITHTGSGLEGRVVTIGIEHEGKEYNLYTDILTGEPHPGDDFLEVYASGTHHRHQYH